MQRRKKFIPIGSFARDSIVKNALFTSFILTLASLVTLLVVFTRLPPVAPLFYSTVRGAGQLAPKKFLYLLPATSAIFFFSHLYLAKISFKTDRMFARILATTSLLVSFLFTTALIHIIIIVL